MALEQKTQSPGPAKGPQNAEEAADYFLRTEEAFVLDGLRVGVEAFLKRLEARVELDAEILSSEQITKVFQDYKTIHNFNFDMFKTLQDLRIRGTRDLLYGMGSALQQFIGFFGVYQNYIKNFKESSKFNEQLKKNNKSYRIFCAVGDKCHGHKVDYYLKLPVKRLPQYLRLLAKVYDLIPDKGTKHANDLGESIFKIKKVTDQITQRIHDSDSRLLVYELNHSVFGGKLNLVTPNRYVVRHGELMSVTRRAKPGKSKTFKVILFNDMLLWGTQKALFSSGALEKALPTSEMKVETTETTVDYCEKNQFKVTTHNGESFVFASKSDKTAGKWVEDIKDAVDTEYHSLHPTNIVDLEKRVANNKKFPPSPQGMAETVDQKDPTRLTEIKTWSESKKDLEFQPVPLSPAAQRAIDSPPTMSAPPVPGRPSPRPAPGAPPKKPAQQNAAATSPKPSIDAPPTPTPDYEPTSPPPAVAPPAPSGAAPPPGAGAPPGAAAPPPAAGGVPPPGGVGAPAAAAPPPNLADAMAAVKPPPSSAIPSASTSAPKPQAASTGGGGGMGGDLLAAIRSGKQLKKVEVNETESRGRMDSRSQLLNQIQQGRKLKHVTKEMTERPALVEEESNDMASLLQNSLKNYRRFVVDEEEDESDDEWE